MSTFIKNGYLGREHGYLIPVTTEDPSVRAIFNDHLEYLSIAIYVGNTFVDEVTMNNFREMSNSVSALPVYLLSGEDTKRNIWSFIREQYIWEKLKEYGKDAVIPVLNVHSLKALDQHFSQF